MSQTHRRQTFWLGVILIALSSIGGMICLFLGGVTSIRQLIEAGHHNVTSAGTRIFTNTYLLLYLLSWIPFLLGVWISGKEGLIHFKIGLNKTILWISGFFRK